MNSTEWEIGDFFEDNDCNIHVIVDKWCNGRQWYKTCVVRGDIAIHNAWYEEDGMYRVNVKFFPSDYTKTLPSYVAIDVYNCPSKFVNAIEEDLKNIKS